MWNVKNNEQVMNKRKVKIKKYFPASSFSAEKITYIYNCRKNESEKQFAST
jgi:hypothetical protein